MMKKSIALIFVCLVSVVLAIVLGSLFLRVKGAYEFSRVTKEILQAENLAESCCYFGVEKLNNKLTQEVEADYSTLTKYWDEDESNGTPLDFLCYLAEVENVPNLEFKEGDCLGAQAQSDQLEILLDEDELPDDELGGEALGTDISSITIYLREREDADENLPYEFTVSATASVNGTTRTVNLIGGEFGIEIEKAKFSRYALFTTKHTSPSGSLVWFTDDTKFYGPVHTNGQFCFAFNPGAYFSDVVTQADQYARFYNNGWTKERDDDHYGTTDVPTFDAGFTRGITADSLGDSVSKEYVKNEALSTMSEPSSAGVYLPANTSSATETIAGTLIGGIYVKGDAEIGLSVDSTDNAVYTIERRVSWYTTTTTTVTVDRPGNITTVNDGSATSVYLGVPDGASGDGTIIYVSGDIDSLSGTVQQDTDITITSEDDMFITGNILYEAYDLDENGNPTAEGYDNVLGLISWEGDVIIGTTAPNDLSIYAVIMAPNGVFTVYNYDRGTTRGDVTLLGGVITDKYGAFGTFSSYGAQTGYGRNFVYDSRMKNMAPPYFPETSNLTISAPELDDVKNLKMIWREDI